MCINNKVKRPTNYADLRERGVLLVNRGGTKIYQLGTKFFRATARSLGGFSGTNHFEVTEIVGEAAR